REGRWSSFHARRKRWRPPWSRTGGRTLLRDLTQLRMRHRLLPPVGRHSSRSTCHLRLRHMTDTRWKLGNRERERPFGEVTHRLPLLHRQKLQLKTTRWMGTATEDYPLGAVGLPARGFGLVGNGVK